jgi:hypothetical protein
MTSHKEDDSWNDLRLESGKKDSDMSFEKIKKNLHKNFVETPLKSLEDGSFNTSMFYSASKAPSISCKIHKKEFLFVDPLSFKLHCKKCFDNGEKNQNLTIFMDDNDNHEDDSDIECSIHSDQKGVFYCDDCQIFLCKLCFANSHRHHKSNLPSDIAKSYKSNLKGIMDNISLVKPKLDENLKGISELDKRIKSIRESSINKIKALITKISSIMNIKYDNTLSQFEALFEGIDVEIENVFKRLESLQKKSSKYLNDISEIIQYVNSDCSRSSIDICQYKKTKSATIVEINKMLEDCKNFMGFKIENTKLKANTKVKEFNQFIEKIFKQNQIYEKSVLNSIKTGISSSSIRLRRYSKFSKKIYQYYKSSSLFCKVNSTICLVGFGLCGLYNSSPSDAKMVNNMTIPIEIEVSEVKNEEGSSKKHSLIKESHSLNIIVNMTDPTMVIYLNRAINLKPENQYLLTITNLHKESYLELWCGQVAKFFLKDMKQHIHCNTSGFNFGFYPAEGVESDFNEFDSGLIADIIYSSSG